MCYYDTYNDPYGHYFRHIMCSSCGRTAVTAITARIRARFLLMDKTYPVPIDAIRAAALGAQSFADTHSLVRAKE